MHFEYAIFDAHCDTADKWINKDKKCEFSLKNAKLYKQYTQVMAVWIDAKKIRHPFLYTQNMLTMIQKKCKRTKIIQNANDFGKKDVSILLSVEGGEALEGNLENLRLLFDRGVRLMTLTWNYPNAIGEPSSTQKKKGLTAFGKDVICKMNHLGMAVDVSHLSEQGFWDVLEVTQKPIIASHSASKTLCAHTRNLSDEQVEAIIKTGGIIGINFYPTFLGGDSIEDIIRHILYFLDRGGENHIGFGSDFDGADALPKGISGNMDMYKIINALLRRNIREDIVQKLAFYNMKRYFTSVLPSL